MSSRLSARRTSFLESCLLGTHLLERTLSKKRVLINIIMKIIIQLSIISTFTIGLMLAIICGGWWNITAFLDGAFLAYLIDYRLSN